MLSLYHYTLHQRMTSGASSRYRISRLHAKLIFVDGKWQIEDAESLNGLKYRGERVSDHFLENGDRITLAPDVVLSYKEVV